MIDKIDLHPGDTRNSVNRPPGQDLRLTYHSDIDDSYQPYALYIPSKYDSRRKWPVVINLHGTSAGWSEEFTGQTSEHYSAEENASPLFAAEQYGAILLTPFGRGVTEFRGIGENDVFRALKQLKHSYSIDWEKISITGLSMGGTGASEIALHRPNLFSAVAPIGAAYSFPWLAVNGMHLPFWCIGGENDLNFHVGGKLVAEAMIKRNYPTRLDIREGRYHSDFVPEYYKRIFPWLVKHRRVVRPDKYVSCALLPTYGRSYCTSIEAIEIPGKVGTLSVDMSKNGVYGLTTDNISCFSVSPYDLVKKGHGFVIVEIDGERTFEGEVNSHQEIWLEKGLNSWGGNLAPRRARSITDYRTRPIGRSADRLVMEGLDSPMARWISDAMRIATGADLAIYNRRHYRGLPIPKGTVDEVDLIQCSRPFEEYLALVYLSGRDIVNIVEDNLREDAGHEYVIQPSGFTYTFSWDKPFGTRLTNIDIDTGRTYLVALEGQAFNRRTLYLAGRESRFDVRVTNVPLRGAMYAHVLRTGAITSQGRRIWVV